MNGYPVWYLIFYPGVFLIIVLGGLVVMAVVGTAALLWYDAKETRRAVRMAEAKVVSPELILRSDIDAETVPESLDGYEHPPQAWRRCCYLDSHGAVTMHLMPSKLRGFDAVRPNGARRHLRP